MSLISTVSSGFKLVRGASDDLSDVQERKKQTSCLNRSLDRFKSVVNYPLEKCNQIRAGTAAKITSLLICLSSKITPLQSLYKSSTEAMAMCCAKKTIAHAAKLTSYIPKDTGVAAIAEGFFTTLSSGSSQSLINKIAGENSAWGQFATFVTDKVIAPRLAPQLKMLDPREQLVKNVFYPLIHELNVVATQQVVQMGVEIGLCYATTSAIGGMSFGAQVFNLQNSASTSDLSATAIKIGIQGYIYGRPVAKAGKFAMQCCLSHRQIKKINKALENVDLTPLMSNLVSLQIPYASAAKPIVKGIIIALADCGLLGTLDFKALTGDEKALNNWLNHKIILLTQLTSRVIAKSV